MDQSSGFMKIDKLTADTSMSGSRRSISSLSSASSKNSSTTPPAADQRGYTLIVDQKRRKAMAVISLSLLDSNLEHVSNVTTALQIWKAIMAYSSVTCC